MKNSPANGGDAGSIPGLGRPLEQEMAAHSSIFARGAWLATVHGVARQSDTMRKHTHTHHTHTHTPHTHTRVIYNAVLVSGTQQSDAVYT